MTNTIKCKKCGAEIEVSEAFAHQIEEEIRSSMKKEHAKDLEEAKRMAQKIADEEKERNARLLKQLEELNDEMRKLRRKDEERDLEFKKNLAAEEEKIKHDVRKKVNEEHEMKDLEKDKKLTDAMKQIDDLKNKMQQGSQQTQGEVFEEVVENALKKEFPSDKITEVKKGERGADLIHTIIDKLGRECGMILWETKNAQWQPSWISKLKEDQRAKKAALAVLVTINKPDWLNTAVYKDGVWITSWQFITPLAYALRFNLIALHHERAAGDGKSEKMEVLYQYLTGTEFKHRIEAIVEAFGNMQDELEREKRWFSAKWNRQEKEIRKVLDHTHGMHGDLQHIIGRSLPEIKSLELPESSKSQ